MTCVRDGESGGTIDTGITMNIDGRAGIGERIGNVTEESGKVCCENRKVLLVVGSKEKEVTHLGCVRRGGEAALTVNDMCESAELFWNMGLVCGSKPDTGARDDLKGYGHLGS